MYHKYYIQQVHPEMTYMVNDPWVDNPMLSNDMYYASTEMEKVNLNMHANRNLYHHVFR